MQTNPYFTKTRWLVTIILLTPLCIGQIWGANQTYTLVAQGDLSSLSSTDKVLIVSSNGSSSYFALKNEQKTSNANLAEISVTITSNSITADLESDYTWYLEFKENQTISGNSYPTFYVKSTKGNYYISNTGNTGSTVNTKNATDANNVWAIGYQGSYTNKNGTYYVTGLYNMGQSRMIAHYSSDWRCYASSNWPNLDGRVVQIYKMQVASCGSATPSATGTASLNGSFNMTSTTSAISVASGTWGPGSNCSWSDYGFVWSDGTATTTPTVSNNKVQVGTSGTGTSWTGSVTPSGSTTPTSWTTGHTYYVRAYGKNNNGSATFAYGSAWSFTPRCVTFKANGGTGSDKVQYVQGGVSTALTSNSFTRTGYSFNGWNTNADGTSGTGYTDGQSVNLGADLILFAKWLVKTTTVSFNQNSGTGGQTTSKTATYGSAMPTPITCPTREGYDFGGYYDGAGGTGTQYYDENGASARNWDKEDATYTLYAKWTIKSYAITWMVDGVEWSDKGGTANANYNSAWSTLTLPTDPGSTELTGCGANKFVGWTTTEGYESADTPPTSLLNSGNKASKTNTYITGTTVFHAVFADYGE